MEVPCNERLYLTKVLSSFEEVCLEGSVMKFVFLFVWVSRNISISAPRVYRNGMLMQGIES